jgi:hypothetical protein
VPEVRRRRNGTALGTRGRRVVASARVSELSDPHRRNVNKMENHNDVSKSLGPAQKQRGGVQPNSGDAPRPGLRLFDSPSPHDHVHNTVPVRGSDAASWEPGGPEVPARPTRARVAPDNSGRRKPIFDVTCIRGEGSTASGDTYASHAGNHLAELVPTKL